MSEAAIAKWPGNKLPIFKKDLEAKKELEELVEEITEECSYEPVGFDQQSIRQHIHVLDVINERRRRHRNGHDYTQVSIGCCPGSRVSRGSKNVGDLFVYN